MASDSAVISDRGPAAADGDSYQGGEWVPALPSAAAGPRSLMTAEADAMHGVLVQRADALEGCTEGSDEEAEFKRVVDAIKAYEANAGHRARSREAKVSRS